MIKDVTYKQVNVFALNEYFEETFGHNPDIVNAEEWRNDSYYKLQVIGELTADEFVRACWLTEGRFVGIGTANLVLETLCVNGHIEPGLYLVESWW